MERKFLGVWVPAWLWLREDLTISEKMLYLEIESLDNDFGCVASNKKLGKVIQLAPTSVSRYLKSLEEKKLIAIAYDDYNTFSGRKIIVTPCENDKGPCQNVKPPCENVKHSNTISDTFSNNDIDKSISGELFPTTPPPPPVLSATEKCQLFIAGFNQIRRTKFKSNKMLCGKLNARLEDKYTTKDIFAALRNAMKDEYHIETKFKYLTPEFMLRPDKIDKFLNIDTGVPAPERRLVQ